MRNLDYHHRMTGITGHWIKSNGYEYVWKPGNVNELKKLVATQLGGPESLTDDLKIGLKLVDWNKIYQLFWEQSV